MAFSGAAKMLGRERAMRRMAAIPALAREKVRVQLLENAAELVRAQKQLVRVEDGDLRDSIRDSDDSDETRIRAVVEAGGPTTTRPVRKGQDAEYDYALAQEFGTSKMGPHRFFFPPYRAMRRRFKANAKKAGKEGVATAIRKP